MAWNEPDNNDRKNDPWGSRPGKKDQGGPPDLDQLFGDFLRKLGGLFGGPKRSPGGSDAGLTGIVVAVVLVVAATIYTFIGFYTVNEQERGVVLRLGRVVPNVVQPGWHWNPPLIDSITIINVTRVYDKRFNNSMLTEDDNIVDISMTVQYVITDPRKFFLNVENPEISLQQASESALRHVVGSSRMDDVINTGRELLAQDTRMRLQTYLDNYGTGIQINQLNIAQSQAPQQVRAAFDDVNKAIEDKQSIQNDARRYASQVVPEARGAALRQIQEANAYKEKVIARAQGDAQRFTQLLVEYQKAPKVTRERMYLDAMQDIYSKTSKVLVDVKGGNNMLYLPLEQLIKARRIGETTTSADIPGPATYTITPPPRASAREAGR